MKKVGEALKRAHLGCALLAAGALAADELRTCAKEDLMVEFSECDPLGVNRNGK